MLANVLAFGYRGGIAKGKGCGDSLKTMNDGLTTSGGKQPKQRYGWSGEAVSKGVAKLCGKGKRGTAIMKTTIRNLTAAIFVATSLQAHAQSTLDYDQQSATGPVAVIGNGNADGLHIQTTPLTQSFVPTLSDISFVQLEFADFAGNGNSGATVYVDLWSGSPHVNSATLLGTSASVYMPNGFNNSGLVVAGITNFYFSTAITLTPGQTYYLQPVVASGDNPWDIITIGNTYANGQLYDNGSYLQPLTDLWFREGVVVPEPTSAALLGIGIILACFRARRNRNMTGPVRKCEQ